MAGNRETLLWVLIQNGVLCWIYAEGASFLDAIGYASARVYWLGVLSLEVFLGYLFLRKTVVRDCYDLLGKLKEMLRGRAGRVISGGLVLLVPLFLLAAWVPPNNYDSNHYHLHRILAWMHYGNLEYYATPYLQQLYLNVFAEYAVLSFYLVTGTDQWVNLVQFFAGMGCLVGASLLAKELGVDRFGQVLSAFTLLTVPSFVFELTTTQVELVATCYFLSFLYFGLKLSKQFSWHFLVGMGLSLSFSIFSKYPAALYAIPFCLYFGGLFLAKYRLQRSFLILGGMILCLGVIFGPFWSRNYALFGDVMSPKEGSRFVGEKLTADRHSAVLTLSNFIKNSSLHWGFPHNGYNKQVEGVIREVHSWLGVDVNEPAISRDEFDVRFTVHEDMIPNSVHFLLLVVFTMVLCFHKSYRKLGVFWVLALIGYLLFCSALKFQHWSTRTHLPFFAMGAVMIGGLLSSFPRFLRIGILILLFLPAAFFVVGNPSKPIVPLGYWMKSLAGHIPAHLCVSIEEKDRYEQVVGEVYDFQSTASENCYPLVGNESYSKRKLIFRELDRLGYYSKLSQTIFNTSKAELYFMNDREKFLAFRKLMPEIKGEKPGVGVLGRMNDGFYFYQASLRAFSNVEADFEYVYTADHFSVLPNAQKPHCYRYILTDDLALVNGYFPQEEIDRVVTGEGKLSLVVLKENSCQRFTF